MSQVTGHIVARDPITLVGLTTISSKAGWNPRPHAEHALTTVEQVVGADAADREARGDHTLQVYRVRPADLA